MPVNSATFNIPVTVRAVQTQKQLPDGAYVKTTDATATAGDAFIVESQTSDDVTTAMRACMNKLAASPDQIIGVTLTVVGAEFLGKPLQARSATAVNFGDVIVYSVKKDVPDIFEPGFCPRGYGKSGSGLCNGSVAGQYRNSNPAAGETVAIKSCPLGLCALCYLDPCACCPLPFCCFPLIGCCGNGIWIGIPGRFPFCCWPFSCVSFDGDTLWFQTMLNQQRLVKIPENSSVYRI